MISGIQFIYKTCKCFVYILAIHNSLCINQNNNFFNTKLVNLYGTMVINVCVLSFPLYVIYKVT